jgi:ubiquinone/menaquinone biosynthesis C-methylase UbiE
VFNNLITIDDFALLCEKMRRNQLGLLLSRSIFGRTERIKRRWQYEIPAPSSCWQIPAVQKRWNQLISGDPTVSSYEHVSKKYLAGKGNLTGLSLGCGGGESVLRWAGFGNFTRIDAYDLSESRVRHAAEEAERRGFADVVRYYAADVYEIPDKDDYYDVIIVEQALHHFTPLRDLLDRVSRFLKENGYFIVNEFVGPTRFQWTARQLEIANALLTMLPEKFRREKSGKVKSAVRRYGRLAMRFYDPSEAVESSRIMPLLSELFEMVEVREYGGTLLQILLAGIAHNFIADNGEAQEALKIIFDVEDMLLRSKEITSDYVLAVCRKKAAQT